jgi:protein involved in ribonucleotide reduction
MTKWVAVCFHLDQQIESPRISRKVIANGNRYYHVVNVRIADQIDEELGVWLTEAFELDG